MPRDRLRLLLTELEMEVVAEALDLYVRARAPSVDRRFEYRYRAARSVLESLRQGNRTLDEIPGGDDDEATRFDGDPAEGRPVRETHDD